MQRTTDIPVLPRHNDRQRDNDQAVEGSRANCSTSRQKEQIVFGTLSPATKYNFRTSKRVFSSN